MSTPPPSPIGQLLRQQRMAATLSQEELAERAGLSVRAVSDLERGVHRVPRLETVRLLADALGLNAAGRAELLAAAHPRGARPATHEPARSAAAPSLPNPLTPLIGRESEVATIVQLLAHDAVRLFTITGPGGVGKTRLALQVAVDVWEAFPDGVWFVDLSPLDDPSLVLPAVGTVLGLRPGEVTAQRLSSAIGDTRLLLVLDNFERLLAAASLVADLLAQAPHVKVLVTSRIPLHVYGEQEYPLAPLSLPDPAHLPSVEHLTQFASARLFVVRAQAVKPDFTVTDANAPAVAKICSRLDGLPLAIELAAARIKVLPPQALLKRLEQRLPLLTAGARTAPARQQTMRDTIAWSHDLLSPEEQTVFRRLSVFAGGCTIDAAEAVAGAGDTLDVFGIMAALVDESLLRQEESLEGEPRLRMLETVREYGLEQLDASGEGDATRDRLAAWSLLLSQQTAPDEYFGNMSSWSVARVDEELPNLRAAITWLLARGEATRALRLLVAAEEYWLQRHITNTELHRWLEMALAAAPDAPGGDRAIAHWILSFGNGILGKDEAQLRHAQQMLATAKELGDPHSLGYAHVAIARAWEHRGQLAQAAAAFAKATAAFAEAKALMPRVEIYIQAALGDLLILQGHLAAGIPMVKDALTRLRATTDPPWYQVLVINTGGYAALRQPDLPRAARLFAESLDKARELHYMPSLQSALIGLAGAACGHGQAQRAARLLGASEAVRDALGMKRWDNWLHAEGITADTQAALPVAAFEEAWSAGRAVPLEVAVAEALAVANDVAAGARG